MKAQDLLKEALNLPPNEKSLLVDGLLKSLDEPNQTMEQIWAEEIDKRVKALHEGKIKTIPYK